MRLPFQGVCVHYKSILGDRLLARDADAHSIEARPSQLAFRSNFAHSMELYAK